NSFTTGAAPAPMTPPKIKPKPEAAPAEGAEGGEASAEG
ncbi:MAG: 30S ribosomal protein S16, partial [Planctomycetaceae bacterium]|nr:30S ribosomal protein S16 [Planctomycetaceae bacterium]